MKALNRRINSLLATAGYKIEHLPSVAHDVAQGRYRWLQDRNIATVLDIGANAGQFAAMIRLIFPRAMIYAFEPLESCFRELRVNASSLAPMQCFHCALGREDAVMTMHRNDASPSSSILAMGKPHRDAFPSTQHSVEESITVRTLDGVVPEIKLRPGVLAKIDVQGYELHVLAGAERTLPLIDTLVIETSFLELYEGQPLFHDIYAFLHDRQFSYGGTFGSITDPRTGGVLQEDSLFFNRRTTAG